MQVSGFGWLFRFTGIIFISGCIYFSGGLDSPILPWLATTPIFILLLAGKNIVDKVFQPFFTTKPSGEGTELGLSLSYDIIAKAHNGNINVKTIEGAGTDFIIQLPVP